MTIEVIRRLINGSFCLGHHLLEDFWEVWQEDFLAVLLHGHGLTHHIPHIRHILMAMATATVMADLGINL